MESLRDPSTGKCCPTRCSKEANRIDSTVNNLLIQITRYLSTQAAESQARLNKALEPITKSLTSQAQTAKEKLSDLFRPIQDSLITRYANANARAQELMRNPTPKQEGEVESEPEQEPETTPSKSLAEQRDAIQKRESESASPQKPVSKAESPQSAMKTPESPKPEQTKKTPKKPEECFDIDFCEPLYVFLSQWQEQNVKVQQQTQEAYRQCCEQANPPAKPEDNDFPVVKAPMTYFYQENPDKEK
jgi:hypothetical protein